MTTGTGLMLLGMWAFAAVCCGSKNVTNEWGLISVAIALLTTLIAAMAS